MHVKPHKYLLFGNYIILTIIFAYSNITRCTVNKFDEIPTSDKLRIFSVLIENNPDPNCPYPSKTLMWWNILQFGNKNRLTQIANQAFIGRSGNNELWIRSKHDNSWSDWTRL